MKSILLLLILSLAVSFLSAQNGSIIKISKLPERQIRTTDTDKSDSFSILKELINSNYTFLKIEEKETSRIVEKEKILHEQFQEYYKGIKVEDGVYIVHSTNNKVISVNGSFIQINDIQDKPLITDSEALDISLNYIKAEIYAWDTLNTDYDELVAYRDIPKGELVIVSDIDQNFKLAYTFYIVSIKPFNTQKVYINACTGGIIKVDNLLADATPGPADTRYSGTKTIYTSYSPTGYYLNNSTAPANYVYNSMKTYTYTNNNFFDADNNWSATEWDNSNLDNIALDVYWGCSKVQDFLHDIIGINSYDNNNGSLRSYVHYGVSYQNASSFPDNPIMRFGDGDGTNTGPWGSLDLVAHEIGHKIVYSALSSQNINDGALKEGFCDIFAIGAENYIAPEKQIWNFAEDMCISCSFERSFSNPNSPGRDGISYADTYGGSYWNGTVYQKSTVLSHWFYVFNEGESGTNDIGYTYHVVGIDNINESSQIVYNVLDNYLTVSSTFQDVKEQSIEFIQDTYGDVSTESLNAMQAWYAVGVPGDCYVYIENITINNSSSYVDLDVGDCSIEFNNVTYSNSTNASYKAGSVTITGSFEVPVGATLEIN